MSALHTSTPLEIKRGMAHHFGGQVDEAALQMLASILPAFKESSLHSLLCMRDALSRRDGEQLLQAANAMKDSSNRLGLERLSHLCERIGMRAEERAFATAALELRLLAAEYRQVQEVLDGLLVDVS